MEGSHVTLDTFPDRMEISIIVARCAFFGLTSATRPAAMKRFQPHSSRRAAMAAISTRTADNRARMNGNFHAIWNVSR